MSEVTVKATKLKFFYKGDTLVYDASAFNLPEGSMLDDLIRQLPGAELRENGEILVNGRKVDQLLLQGRHMFDNNRQLILENLPYFTVKNIKVFETEGSAFDPLNKFYVMDVNLKKEFLNSFISNAEAGGGTDGRFMARAFVLGMTERSMASAYVNVQNLNDIAKPGERGDWNPQNAGDGIPTNTLAGIRYEANNKDNTVMAKGSVDFSRTSNDVETTSLQENYLTGGNTFQNSFHTAHSRDISLRTDHNLSFAVASGFISRVRISPMLRYRKYDNKSRYTSASFNENVASGLGKDWADSIASPQAGSVFFPKASTVF